MPRRPAREVAKQRLFAHPARPAARDAGGDQQIFESTGEVERLLELQGTTSRELRARPQGRRAQAAAPRLAGRGGTMLGRIGRTTQHAGAAPAASRSARPAAAPRASTRSRSSTAGSCSSRPRSTAPSGKNPFFGAGRQEPVDRPDPADEQGGAVGAACSPTRASTIYACGRHDIQTGQIDRRVLATLEFLSASGLKPTVTSLKCGHSYLTDVGQRLRAHDRHAPSTSPPINGDPDPRPPGQGLDHRARDPAPADAPGHDEAAPDHLADDVRRHRQHARDGRPQRPHPRRLPAAVRRELQALQAGRRGAQARPVDQADRPPRRASTTRSCASSRPSTRSRPSSARRTPIAAIDGAAARRRSVLPFVQWEFPGRLGPDPGRYVLRRFAGDPAHHVLVLESGEAPRRRRLGRGRPRRAGPEPAPVDVTRATVVAADAVGESEAAGWLRAAGERGEQIVADALAVLNEALHAHRVSAADPYARTAARAAAQVTRIGYGTGEQVADGRWEAALELLRPRRHGGRRRSRRRSASPPCCPGATWRWPARS